MTKKSKEDRDFVAGNTGPDGEYIVGRGKPPEEGKFRKGDNRVRGRRTKGTPNSRTAFSELAKSPTNLKISGEWKVISQLEAIAARLFDSAQRGNIPAIKLALEYVERAELSESALEEQKKQVDVSAYSVFTDEEFDQYDRLSCKLRGEPYVPLDPNSLLGQLSDPTNPENYRIAPTLEGIVYKKCRITGIKDEIIEIRNSAYVSAAHRRNPGCHRGRDPIYFSWLI